jgi:azurin
VSDSGLGFSHNRFIGLIVVIGMLVLLFEGISIFGGNIIKAQVERSTSKNHPNKNIEKRLQPATVLSEKEVSGNSQSDDGVDAVIKFVAADSCNQVIEGNDMLQFNLKEMVVSSSCSEITVTLKHTGAMPANVMGHNWVLTNTADFMPVATAGGGAGMANNYVPVNDARVIAASAVIGGGAETSVTFSGDLLSAGGDYTFFCSFPGHYMIMKGSFVVRD